VPHRRATTQQDGLRRLVRDAESARDLAGERSLPFHIHPVHLHIRMPIHEPLDLTEGLDGGGSGRAVLEHERLTLFQRIEDILLLHDFLHSLHGRPPTTGVGSKRCITPRRTCPRYFTAKLAKTAKE